MIFLMYIISTGHESSGLTIIWATISLQGHPEILQKLEAFREAKRDGQMNGIHHTKRLEGDDLVHGYRPIPGTFLHFHLGSDGFSYASFEAVGYDFNTIELSQLRERERTFESLGEEGRTVMYHIFDSQEQRKRSSLLLTQVHQGTNGLRSLAGSVRCLATLKWDWSRNN
ncbi:hypothetical protein HID58_074424 [Brassica napus]|uniref:Uncharacterized protein n=1 Tax=Brassica napus TaxID=3708 RepID=A0ABQ7YIH8_BRANA|nr:hypothetical protein HID58_074424 [Brassica napus]